MANTDTPDIQKTLVLFKPDSVQRGVVGEILTRFERVGLKIVGFKMIMPDEIKLKTHYEEIGKLYTRRGEHTFGITIEMMTKGPIIAMVLEGVEAVELVRKLVGPTEPKSAAPGTIRGDYSHMSFGYADRTDIGIPNLVHASGDYSEAVQEVSHWFDEDELFTYERSSERFIR